MIPANSISKGMLIIVDGSIHKVLDAELRGSAKAEKLMHARLLHIDDQHHLEQTFHPDDKVDHINPDRFLAQYLYKDEESFYFMNDETFEQLTISKEIVGKAGDYLKEETKIHVESYEGKPIHIVFPEIVEVVVDQAPEASGTGQDTTFKEAVIENGKTILVPQFVKSGDKIRVDVATDKYVDRIKK